jgi:hypothetical protein
MRLSYFRERRPERRAQPRMNGGGQLSGRADGGVCVGREGMRDDRFRGVRSNEGRGAPNEGRGVRTRIAALERGATLLDTGARRLERGPRRLTEAFERGARLLDTGARLLERGPRRLTERRGGSNEERRCSTRERNQVFRISTSLPMMWSHTEDSLNQLPWWCWRCLGSHPRGQGYSECTGRAWVKRARCRKRA